jgi:hypothetical protein
MKFLLLTVLAVFFVAGCGPSVKTAYQADKSLTSNFAGIKVGISVTYPRSSDTRETDFLYEDGKKATTREAERFFKNFKLDGRVSGKVVQVNEESIFGKGRPLIAIYPILAEDRNVVVATDLAQVKEELTKNDIDCLILFTAGMLSKSDNSINWTKFGEFGFRMASAVAGGLSTASSSSGFTGSGSFIKQSMIYYTCGEKTLYLGGTRGEMAADPAHAALNHFSTVATTGKVD